MNVFANGRLDSPVAVHVVIVILAAISRVRVKILDAIRRREMTAAG